jgi:hypothetical protein
MYPKSRKKGFCVPMERSSKIHMITKINSVKKASDYIKLGQDSFRVVKNVSKGLIYPFSHFGNE